MATEAPRHPARSTERSSNQRGPYVAVADGHESRLVELEPRVTHLGRGLTAHIRLEDDHVCVDHAIIVRHGRFARLLDHQSPSGTYLNGRRIRTANLHDGDVIQLGSVCLQYVEIR
jgi:pSer/pThr/pTyr-binding forkhead associated (FHA) protein